VSKAIHSIKKETKPMLFTFDNGTYRIYFRYDSRIIKPYPHDPEEHRQDITMAIIKVPGQDGEVITSGQVAKYFRDKPDRDLARKLALRKALRTMNATEAFRTAAWQAYHTRPGGLLHKQT
jgi:hypothetical protein